MMFVLLILQKNIHEIKDVVGVLSKHGFQYFDIGVLIASLNESGSCLKKLKLLTTPTPEMHPALRA